MTRYMNSAGSVASAFACITLASCSNVERLELSSATLEGKVTYRGKPVPYAMIIVASESASSMGAADAQGHYKVNHAPTGAVKIAVNTEAGKGIMMGQMMGAKQSPPPGEKKASFAMETPKFVDVPKKFFDPATSGITTTVNDAANTYDIAID